MMAVVSVGGEEKNEATESWLGVGGGLAREASKGYPLVSTNS